MFLGIWFIILAALTTLSIAYGLCYHGYHMVRMWEKPVAVGYMLILALVNQNVCHKGKCMTSYQSSRDIIVIVMNDTHDFEGKRCATLETADEANIKTCATAVILFSGCVLSIGILTDILNNFFH